MKRRPLPRSFVPHACLVLAIDPGEQGGAAIHGRGAYHGVFEVRPGDESRIVECALRLATELRLPLVVVGETWTFGGRRADPRATGAMRARLSERWGMWLGALLAAGFPKRRIVRVNSRTWQARELGAGWGVKSDELKRRARAVAQRLTGNAGAWSMSDDAADAVCIAWWARTAGEVEAVLPKPRAPKGRAA